MVHRIEHNRYAYHLSRALKKLEQRPDIKAIMEGFGVETDFKRIVGKIKQQTGSDFASMSDSELERIAKGA